MAVNVSGSNGLFFESGIELDQLEQDARKAGAIIDSIPKKGAQSFEQAQKSSQSFFTSIAGGVLALGAASKTLEFFGDAINEALDAEQSTARFKNTLESINRADLFDNLVASANKLQQQFKYLDNDEIVGVFTKLITYGKLTKSQIEQLTPVIIDFSAKQRISIEQGSSIIIKALEGNTRSLKEYGIEIKKGATESDRLAAIMTQLKSKVEGAGEAFEKTTSGGLATAQQTFKDLKEEIGTGLLPTLNKLLNWVNGALQGLPILAQKIKNTFSDIGTFFSEGLQATKDNIRIRQTLDDYASADRNVQKQVNEFADKSSKEIYQKIDELTSVLNAKQKYLDVLRASEMKGEKFTPEDVKNLHDHKLGVYQLSGTIEGLKKFLDKPSGILGVDNNSNDDLKEHNKNQAELNSLLSDRANILKAIKDIQRDSTQTGLTEEQKQIDSVAERYDNLISKIDEYNKKAAKFGRPTISDNEVVTAKTTAINNIQLKQDAARYKTFLEEQKNLFEQYENAKKEIGIKNANELFDEQRKGFTSYQDFLQAEVKKNMPNILTTIFGMGNTLNIGDKLKMKSLFDSMSQFSKNQKQDAIENLKDLLAITEGFSERRELIENKYQKLFKTLSDLRGKISEDEYERRLKALQGSQDDELQIIQDSIIEQSQLVKRLGTNLIGYSRDQIKRLASDIEGAIKSGTFIDASGKIQPVSPELLKRLKDYLAQLKEAYGLSKKLEDAKVFDAAGAGLSTLANELADVNKEIAQSVAILGQMAANVGSTLKALDAFKTASQKDPTTGKADLVGQITSLTSIISSILSGIKLILDGIRKTKQEQAAVKAEVANFYNQMIAGEEEYQLLLRNRERQQVLLNKLTLQGLEDQRKLLEQQKKSNTTDFNDIFSQLQSEKFLAGVEAKKKSLFKRNLLELRGDATETKQIFESLAGKNFDQLNELFVKGQLTGKAKELFEQLQKIKAEGADIDSLLEENKRRAQEIFTGTTAESITDTIAQGFKNGLHSANDFAGNFEDLMRGAIINSLKFKFLEGPIKDLFDQFASASESGTGLTKAEIDDLQKKYNAIINNANKQFTDLQQIAGLNFSGSSQQNQNVLQGSFKQLTEDTGNELLGSFNGQRIATLQILEVQKSALANLNNIELNTASTVAELKNQTQTLITYFRDIGVKMK
jgi:hypothetical protein